MLVSFLLSIKERVISVSMIIAIRVYIQEDTYYIMNNSDEIWNFVFGFCKYPCFMTWEKKVE